MDEEDQWIVLVQTPAGETVYDEAPRVKAQAEAIAEDARRMAKKHWPAYIYRVAKAADSIAEKLHRDEAANTLIATMLTNLMLEVGKSKMSAAQQLCLTLWLEFEKDRRYINQAEIELLTAFGRYLEKTQEAKRTGDDE